MHYICKLQPSTVMCPDLFFFFHLVLSLSLLLLWFFWLDFISLFIVICWRNCFISFFPLGLKVDVAVCVCWHFSHVFFFCFVCLKFQFNLVLVLRVHPHTHTSKKYSNTRTDRNKHTHVGQHWKVDYINFRLAAIALALLVFVTLANGFLLL